MNFTYSEHVFLISVPPFPSLPLTPTTGATEKLLSQGISQAGPLTTSPVYDPGRWQRHPGTGQSRRPHPIGNRNSSPHMGKCDLPLRRNLCNKTNCVQHKNTNKRLQKLNIDPDPAICFSKHTTNNDGEQDMVLSQRYAIKCHHQKAHKKKT